jgi:hypothetical protein
MASLTTETSPYDVLSPVSAGATEDLSNDNQDVDVNVDPSVDDTDPGADADADSDVDADALEGDDQSAEEGDPASDADAEAAAKADEAAWKAKDGNLPPALKELIANNPNAGKRLKEMYFTNQRLMKLGGAGELQKMKEAVANIGGVEKLLELKGQIDQMGGEAGFQDAQQELGAWREIDNQWINGDVNLVGHLAESNPASFEKIAPAMFSKLGETNPELYNYLGASIITNTFLGDGTITNMLMMKQALAAGDTKLAAQYFQKIEGNIASLQNMAAQAPKSKAPDPKAQAWEQEKQGYQQKEVQRFQGDVQNRNDAWMAPKVQSELAAYLNGGEKKLSPNTLQRLDEAIRKEIWNKHLSTNAAFMKARAALYQKMDLDGVERLYKQYADKLFPTVTRQIAKEFGLQPAAKRAAAVAQTGGTKGAAPAAKAQGGFIAVDKFPKPSEVDSKATTFDMKLKDQFILKDGRKVQVRPLKRT